MAKKEIDFIIKVNNKEVDLSKTSLEKFDAIVKTAHKDLKAIEQQFGKNSQQYKVAAKDIQNAEAAWQKMTKATKENEEQTKQNTEGIKTYSQQIRIATRELVAIEQQFGKNSNEYAAQAQKVKELKDAQEELTRGTMKLDDALGNLPGPIGQVGQSMQQFEIVSQSAKSAMSSLIQQFPLLKNAFVASGIGAIVVAIGFVVAAVVKAAQSFGPLKDAFASISDAVGALFNALKPVTDFILNVFTKAIEGVAYVLNGLASAFGGANKGLATMSRNLEKQLKLQESILNGFNSALSENLAERLKIENDYVKRQKEIADAEYENELERQRDFLIAKSDFNNKVKELELKRILDGKKRLNELTKIEIDAATASIDNQREAARTQIEYQNAQNIVDYNMLRDINKKKLENVNQNLKDIEKSTIANKEELKKILVDSRSELIELDVYYRDLQNYSYTKGLEEQAKAERQYAREDIAAVNERNIKIIELTTSLIKEENARNLQAAKDRLVRLKEEHRLELEQARLQGVSLKNLDKKQAAERKAAREEVRKAQLQLDAYNIQIQVNEENRRLAEELTRDQQYYQRKRENVLKEYEIDYKLADRNTEKLQEARTKQFLALIEIDKEELGNMRSNLELEYDAMYQVSAEAFQKLRDIEDARFEEQKKGNEQNFQYIEALTKQHAKNLNMIDVQELETMASLLERKADTEKKLYGQMFSDLREAEDLAYAARVKAAGDNVALLEIIEREHVQKIKDLQNQKIQAYAGVATAMLDSFANVTNALAAFYEFESQNTKKSMAERKAAFEQNKKYQIATAALSAASGIIQILTQPSTLPSPFDWIVKIANAAALGIMTAVQISKIKSTEFNDGGASGAGATSSGTYNGLGRNYGDGGMIEGPSHQSAAGGVMVNAEGGEAIMSKGSVSMFGPMLSLMNQMGGGASFIPGLAGAARPDNPRVSTPSADNSTIIKTYVVSSDMTSEQHKQARLKDLSTL
jgi:hypothetical protein